MIVSESDIEFTFGEQYGNLVLKYDDTPYYTSGSTHSPARKLWILLRYRTSTMC